MYREIFQKNIYIESVYFVGALKKDKRGIMKFFLKNPSFKFVCMLLFNLTTKTFHCNVLKISYLNYFSSSLKLKSRRNFVNLNRGFFFVEKEAINVWFLNS